MEDTTKATLRFTRKSDAKDFAGYISDILGVILHFDTLQVDSRNKLFVFKTDDDEVVLLYNRFRRTLWDEAYDRLRGEILASRP